nr:hypothetical protein C4D60_Mb03t08650 [Ipomoea batatas]
MHSFVKGSAHKHQGIAAEEIGYGGGVAGFEEAAFVLEDEPVQLRVGGEHGRLAEDVGGENGAVFPDPIVDEGLGILGLEEKTNYNQAEGYEQRNRIAEGLGVEERRQLRRQVTATQSSTTGLMSARAPKTNGLKASSIARHPAARAPKTTAACFYEFFSLSPI